MWGFGSATYFVFITTIYAQVQHLLAKCLPYAVYLKFISAIQPRWGLAVDFNRDLQLFMNLNFKTCGICGGQGFILLFLSNMAFYWSRAIGSGTEFCRHVHGIQVFPKLQLQRKLRRLKTLSNATKGLKKFTKEYNNFTGFIRKLKRLGATLSMTLASLYQRLLTYMNQNTPVQRYEDLTLRQRKSITD